MSHVRHQRDIRQRDKPKLIFFSFNIQIFVDISFLSVGIPERIKTAHSMMGLCFESEYNVPASFSSLYTSEFSSITYIIQNTGELFRVLIPNSRVQN